MASEVENIRKCFTFIWKIENAEYWWDPDNCLSSPVFTVDEIGETKWELTLFFNFTYFHNDSQLRLKRLDDGNFVRFVEIDCELAFLSADDGKVLELFEEKESILLKNSFIGYYDFPSRYDVFFARRSEFISQDTLTIRCRMWKSNGEISNNVQCIARTRLALEKRSCLWSIKDFSYLNFNSMETFEIKSLGSGEQLVKALLFLSGGFSCEETIRLNITPDYEHIKLATLQVSVLDASNNTVKCFQDDFWFDDLYKSKEFILYDSKREIMEKKNIYLPKDVLSLLFECSFSFGKLDEEIESVTSNCPEFISKKADKRYLDKNNKLSAPKVDLMNDFKCMLSDGKLHDVNLKTQGKTFPSHKCILSLRSPVFEAMFSNNMKENINDCVDIEDLSDETVLYMLRYIYCAEVEELDWDSATDLYRAADKYQILNLRDICASFLKTNLRSNTACEALVLSDLHQDEDLKRFVQNFIMREGGRIVNSEEWEKFMETHVKLAFETMRLKFKVLGK